MLGHKIHISTASRSILALALPSILANITTPLLGLVDMAIVGHMGSPAFIAAIAIGGTCFSMIYWIFSFLRMGTGGTTSQAVGANDIAERDASLWRSMGVAMAIGLMLIALQVPLRSALLSFMGDGADVEAVRMAGRYFDILIYGAPAMMGMYVTTGWFIGVQNSRMTLWTSLTINVVNIAASLLLVYVWGLGIDGVASGTLIAQWTGFAMAMLLTRRYKPRVGRLRELFDGRKMRRFFAVNLDIFLRTLCLVAVTVWFTRAGAMQGDIVLAVNALLMQLFLLFSYVMDGYAYAAEALAGKFTGAGDLTSRRLMVRTLFVHGFGLAAAFTLIYLLGGDLILRVLSNDGAVIAASADYRWWAAVIPFASVGAFIWDGVFVGEMRTRQMLLSMAGAMATFFAVWLLLFDLWGNHALWLAFILYLAGRSLLQTLLYKHKRR